MSQLLFVTGAHKTGTSTLLGMLNNHDDIYLEFELFGNPTYTEKFLERYPDAAPIFNKTKRQFFYREFQKYITRLPKVSDATYVGEKFPSLRFDQIRQVREAKILYIIRDLTTWLLKRDQLKTVYPDLQWPNEMAVEYLTTFLRTFTLPDCFRIRMEDMIGRNDVTRGRISRYLNIPDFKEETKGWWLDIGGWSVNNPKSVSKWWSGHRASFVRPKRFDVRAKINNQHPFWRISLPIFYKYYQSINSVFTQEQIERDIFKLQSLKKVSVFGTADLYTDIKNIDITQNLHL